jgi:hypothetical protein
LIDEVERTRPPGVDIVRLRGWRQIDRFLDDATHG